jgi:nucleoside-diphosphate-sugar epimerase
MALERERGMNWLVTGGCGFLGTALVRALDRISLLRRMIDRINSFAK